MNSKLENSLGCLALLAVVIVPLGLVLAMVAHDSFVSGKQVTFDRAQASLRSALNDFQTQDRKVAFASKQYGYFVVYPFTYAVVLGGTNYQCVLAVVEGYQFDNQGRLAVTTNRGFIWFDQQRGAKLIPDGYKVPRWRSGF